MRAIGLEASDRIERGTGIGRDTTGVDFMRHSPFGEPGAREEAMGGPRPRPLTSGRDPERETAAIG
jgi:hypothetical protein